ncbi:MAG TPA: C1 family peptidase [Blastocatellia bacterium]|nr:C1 family peptidase [Blastocatellia bacterium]
MSSKRSLVALAAMLIVAAFNEPPRVSSQQDPPCAGAQTAGKTDKQIQLADCSCEQSVTRDKPTYRVGAAPFGRKPSPRVGRSARTGGRRGRERVEPENLYEGLEMPDLKDLRSPEVVGLREKVLRARQEARQSVEDSLERARKGLQMKPNNWHANYVLKSPRVRKAYEQFIALQNNGQWVSWPKFDWREQGLDLGPVLDQGHCNSCWAFTSMSAYQSSWNLEQLRLGVGFFELTVGEYGSHQRIPSVQQLLNCIGKEKGDCESGGWHGTAFAFMVNSHVPHIPDRKVWKKGDRTSIEEYTGRVSPCTDTLRRSKVKRGGKMAVPGEGPDGINLPANSDRILTAYDRALAWGYVNERKPDQLPSVAQLKQALIEHGPLAMPIHGDACFSLYQGGVFNGRSIGDPNHVMVLIGWDDEKQAWLIKNSWGEQWGEKGFGWVAYASNNVGLYAAWIQPTPTTEGR